MEAASGSPIQPRASEQRVTPSWTAGRKSSRSLLQAANGAGSGTPGGEQLLDAGVANGDQGELGSHKKGIGQDEHGRRRQIRAAKGRASGCEDSILRRQLLAMKTCLWFLATSFVRSSACSALCLKEICAEQSFRIPRSIQRSGCSLREVVDATGMLPRHQIGA